jgi:two-component system cell cycle response regulator
VLGRALDADIYLDAEGISRRHAEIYQENGRYLLRDLGSTNGTIWRDNRITDPVMLENGDRISLATTVVFRFNTDDELEASLRARLYELATRDPLTNAHNRRFFRERLDSEWPWAERHVRCCALLALDLDFFKRVNDNWGHPAGDYVLSEFAHLVERVIRAEDLFARVGGEEFLVLCRATAATGALRLAERLRRSVEDFDFEWEGDELPVTVSVGVATSDDVRVASPEDLIRRADEALYRAKERGRNRIELATESATSTRDD